MATKQPIDLDSMTVAELTALIAAAEERRTAKMDEAKEAFFAEFRSRAAELGISLNELGAVPSTALTPRKPRKDAGTTPPPKYRSPDGREWSGRGRKPRWVLAGEANGNSLSDFLIA